MSIDIRNLLGDQADYYLNHQSQTISKDSLHLPRHDFVDRIFANSDRNPQVLRNLQSMYNTGRLAKTGYLSIFPVDQGIEHTAGASFAPNPMYFDPENIIRLALDAGCNAVATTLGVLGIMSRKYAHKIPFILKINHNELLSYPTTHDQRMFATVEQAFELGATGIGATIYFGSPESRRQIEEVSTAFARAHDLGMFTIAWCYLRNEAFVKDGTDYHTSADMTGQALHLASTIEADIVKQKLPENNGGFQVINFSKSHPDMYTNLSSDHPIDMTRYQLLNAYAGRIGLISSGGASTGDNDMLEAVKSAIINKRAGGMGLILGRKAFQHPYDQGIELLNAVQDVYLSPDVTIA